jgi:hypothetical protein
MEWREGILGVDEIKRGLGICGILPTDLRSGFVKSS